MAGKKFSMSALLNDQSIVKEEGGTYEIRMIPLDDLIRSPGNHYMMDGIEELADSILQVGLLQNLYVKEADENGKYEIISGHRRKEACQLNVERGYEEWSQVPCHVDGCQDPLLTELKLLEANARTRILTPPELSLQASRLARLYQKLKDQGVKIHGRVRELVANEMGISPAQVSRYESINENLIEGLKEKFKAERIGVTDAYDLSTLTEEEQAQVMEMYEAGGDWKNKIAELIKTRKEAKKKAKMSTPEPEEQAEPSTKDPSKEMKEAGMQAVSGMRDWAEKEESAPVAVDGQPEEEQAAPVAGDENLELSGLPKTRANPPMPKVKPPQVAGDGGCAFCRGEKIIKCDYGATAKVVQFIGGGSIEYGILFTPEDEEQRDVLRIKTCPICGKEIDNTLL